MLFAESHINDCSLRDLFVSSTGYTSRISWNKSWKRPAKTEVLEQDSKGTKTETVNHALILIILSWPLLKNKNSPFHEAELPVTCSVELLSPSSGKQCKTKKCVCEVLHSVQETRLLALRTDAKGFNVRVPRGAKDRVSTRRPEFTSGLIPKGTSHFLILTGTKRLQRIQSLAIFSETRPHVLRYNQTSPEHNQNNDRGGTPNGTVSVQEGRTESCDESPACDELGWEWVG